MFEFGTFLIFNFQKQLLVIFSNTEIQKMRFFRKPMENRMHLFFQEMRIFTQTNGKQNAFLKLNEEYRNSKMRIFTKTN